jgi:tryptophan-associated transmembrane protein
MTKRPLWMVAVSLLGAAAALWGATDVSWGSDHPSFSALALLALASLPGVFAVSGWACRVLGGIVAVAGGYVCWRAITVAGEWNLFSGRGLALLGGVLFLAGGLLIVRHAATLPTMGARYQLANAERRSGDRHTDMWDGLSHGEDPTVDGPGKNGV